MNEDLDGKGDDTATDAMRDKALNGLMNIARIAGRHGGKD